MLLLDAVLRKLIRKGDLLITDWTGAVSRFGDGGSPRAHIRIASAAKAGCPVSKVLNAEITLEIVSA